MTTEFEWDEEKAKVNLRKHSVSFYEAKNENFMNKTTSSNSSDDEMLDDYSDKLTLSHLKKAVRGKYAKDLAETHDSIIKVTSKNGDKFFHLTTIEVEALVSSEGHLTVEVPSNLKLY